MTRHRPIDRRGPRRLDVDDLGHEVLALAGPIRTCDPAARGPRAWPWCSRSPRPAPATAPSWPPWPSAATRSTSRVPRSGIDTRETAEDVARTLACFHRVLCARVMDHRVAGAHGRRPRRRRACACPWSTCSPTGPTPARPWPTCSPCAQVFGDRAAAERPVAYVGDANNVWRSLALAASLAGIATRVASPAATARPAERRGPGPLVRRATVSVTDDPAEAADGGRRPLHRRVDLDGPGGRAGGRAWRPSPGFTVDERTAGRGRPRRRGAALPAGPPGRGDQRRGGRRAPQRGVAAGGQPDARHARPAGLGDGASRAQADAP